MQREQLGAKTFEQRARRQLHERAHRDHTQLLQGVARGRVKAQSRHGHRFGRNTLGLRIHKAQRPAPVRTRQGIGKEARVTCHHRGGEVRVHQGTLHPRSPHRKRPVQRQQATSIHPEHTGLVARRFDVRTEVTQHLDDLVHAALNQLRGYGGRTQLTTHRKPRRVTLTRHHPVLSTALVDPKQQGMRLVLRHHRGRMQGPQRVLPKQQLQRKLRDTHTRQTAHPITSDGDKYLFARSWSRIETVRMRHKCKRSSGRMPRCFRRCVWASGR